MKKYVLLLLAFSSSAFATPSYKNLNFCWDNSSQGPQVTFKDKKTIVMKYNGETTTLKINSFKQKTTEEGLKVDEYNTTNVADSIQWTVEIATRPQDKDKGLFIVIFGEREFFGSVKGCAAR